VLLVVLVIKPNAHIQIHRLQQVEIDHILFFRERAALHKLYKTASNYLSAKNWQTSGQRILRNLELIVHSMLKEAGREQNLAHRVHLSP